MKFQTNLFKLSVGYISFDMIIYLLVGSVCFFPLPWDRLLIFFYILYLILICIIYIVEIIISVLICAINKNISFCLSTFPILDLFSLFICQIFDSKGVGMSWEVFVMVLILYKIGSSIYKYHKYKNILNYQSTYSSNNIENKDL